MTQQEAYFIAAEMEKRAVSMYQRAISLFPDLEEMLSSMLADEREHLSWFQSFLTGEMDGDKVLLSAQAAGILFPGGLVEAHRNHAFETEQGLILYAMEQEKTAIDTYRKFSEKTGTDAFLQIAREEESHLRALEIRLNNIK